MLQNFKKSKLKKGIALVLVTLICIGSSTFMVGAKERSDLKVVDVGHGEYCLLSETPSVSISEVQASNSVKSLKQINKGVFQIDGTGEKLLKVNDTSFLEVGEITVNVRNQKDLDQFKKSNVGEVVKKQIEAFAADCAKNPKNDPIVTVYSPYLLEVPKTATNGQATISSGDYFYYTGTGGYTYKQEYWTMGIRYTEAYNKTYSSGQDAYDAIKATCSFLIGKGLSKLGWGTPYSVYNLLSSILKPIFVPTNVSMLSGTLRVIQGKEYSGEVRYCYIRQDMGHGLDDYLKARSSSSQFQWLERLCVPDQQEENYVVNEPSYTGDYFNNLDQMAYQYKDSTSFYDTQRYYITNTAAPNVQFNLFPMIVS